MHRKASPIEGVTMLLQGLYAVGFDDDHPRLAYQDLSATPHPRTTSRVVPLPDTEQVPAAQPQAEENIDR